MVIAEVPATHVPVEIFGFQVESEHVGKNGVHRPCNVFGGRTCEISRCRQRSSAFVQKLGSFCWTISFHIIFPLHGFDFVSMQAWSSEAKTFVTSLSPRLLYPIAASFSSAPFNPQIAAVFDRCTDVRVSWAMSSALLRDLPTKSTS